MRPTLQIQKIEDYLESLEAAANYYTASQSITWMIDEVGELCGKLAFANSQMTVAKSELNQAKIQAYEKMVQRYGTEKYFAPSLAKDYVNALCERQQYCYDSAERLSRTITHTLEILRSCLSALKAELEVNRYSNTP